MFALHDHAYNHAWIKRWSTQYLLKPEDLDEIRNRLGEKVWRDSSCHLFASVLTRSRLHSTSPSPSPTSPS